MAEQPPRYDAGYQGNCVACHYWEPFQFAPDKKPLTGFCKRFPPGSHLVVFRQGEGKAEFEIEAGWPETSNEDWCGEFLRDYPPLIQLPPVPSPSKSP
jgi:hypothetical protein